MAMNANSPERDAKITIERREHVLLIGINRPHIYNRVDPEAYHALAKAYYDYDHDSSLRVAVVGVVADSAQHRGTARAQPVRQCGAGSRNEGEMREEAEIASIG
jgi:1,4-dihydroxy-2-naphthoyl-CoA synthase